MKKDVEQEKKDSDKICFLRTENDNFEMLQLSLVSQA